MSHQLLIITISCLGSASLQYINTGGPGADTILESPDSLLRYSLPYTNYFNIPLTANEYENIPDRSPDQLPDIYLHDETRKRRTIDDKDSKESQWNPNLIDTDKTLYLNNEDQANPFIIDIGNLDDNETESGQVDKKKFSPWGGKRAASMEHMWTWKRGSAMREPSMPKRVRFSPWGGKRSGQMVYKPGSKPTKIIFSNSIPELTRIVSNYLPMGNKVSLSEFQYIPSIAKRYPVKILALSTKFDEKTLRDALPFKNFADPLQKIFRPGHTYVDVNFKNDGKRKVKFSAWGGKRSPPIIGPIWTPAPEKVKDSKLETILLIRHNQNKDDHAKAL